MASFSNSGPTPQIQSKNTGLGGSSPFSRALNFFSGTDLGSGILNKPQVINSAPKPIPVPTPPAPTTPVKDHTVTHPDGTVVKQTYHAPVNKGLIQTPSAQTPIDTRAPGQTQGMNSDGTLVKPQSTYQQATTGLLDQGQGNNQQINQDVNTLNQIRDSAVKGTPTTDQGLANLPLSQGQTGLINMGAPSNFELGNAEAIKAYNSSAYNNALTKYNADVTQQGQKITALGNAATQTAPQLGQFGQTYYNPSTGESIGGSGDSALNPINNVQSIAQQVISGKISPQQAYSMGGTVSNWQGLLNSEIQKQNPNFDTAKAQGNYESKQTNTTTSGTTPVNAASSVYGKTYNDLLDIKNATSNVDQFGNLLVQNMGGINPSDIKYANKTISEIRNQLSSGQQAQFDTTFAQLKARVAALLQVGGAQIPTQITEDANKIIDGSAPVGTLNAVLKRIQTEGNILTSNIQNKLNTAGSVIGAKPTGNQNNPLGI